ncbi:hypothetical protein [Candidatus Nitrosocosmicus sp. T]
MQFLDLKRKKDTEDPDKKWITSWNDYLWRIKYFYRWLINTKDKEIDTVYHGNWSTSSFINIRLKRTKRLNPFCLNAILLYGPNFLKAAAKTNEV